MPTYRIKIVPHANPNADGEWIEVEHPELPPGTKWKDAAESLSRSVPEGHAMVDYDAEPSSAPKP